MNEQEHVFFIIFIQGIQAKFLINGLKKLFF